MKAQFDAPTLAKEILGKLAALTTGNTETVRRLRRIYSLRLKRAPGADVVDLALLLASHGDFRSRFVAYELIKEHKEAFSILTTPLILELGHGLDSWGKVDCYACYISGPAWREGRLTADVVRGWAQSPDRWWRRAALVSTIALSRLGQSHHVPAIIDICRLEAPDRDPLVVKALSWALRELAKSHPKDAQAFLAQHRAALASLITREVQCKIDTGIKAPRKRE
jgi:3-methyladenine DNA glycosylase AlkD